ncbi:hypothetical protein [Thermococcus siculi]|nr:hypothetical protein [Thermococcus siculi]
MGWREPLLSVTVTAMVGSVAWIAVQLNPYAGAVLFFAAIAAPLLLFRRYYRNHVHGIALFVPAAIVIIVLLYPPPAAGPNIHFGLHEITYCWGLEGDPWPLDENAEVVYSCRVYVNYTRIHVSGIAWKETVVELPVRGGFVILWEPRERMEQAYLRAVGIAEKAGYKITVEDFGNRDGRIHDVLLAKGSKCVYIGEFRILGGGLAVVLAEGPCSGVMPFALPEGRGV